MLRMLGPLQVVDRAGTPVTVGGPKERTVLAVLAIRANEVVAEDRLLEALWGEEPPRTATKTLQAYLSRLRKSLATAAVPELLIETEASGYVLRARREEIDVHLVEDLVGRARQAGAGGNHDRASALLREAEGAWRGRSLGDLADEPFALAEAARLDELRLVVIEERLAADLARGQHRDLVGELEVLTASHPLRERLWAHRMVALYRCGRQAEALRVYQDLRRHLGDELGIDPSPELRALEQAVLTQSADLDWRPAPAAATASEPAGLGLADLPLADLPLPTALTPPDDSFFVGRAGEQARLLTAWKEAASGRRHAVLLSGEPGIGKTRLAAEVAREARTTGGLVLYGRCDEGLGVPYQPFAEAFRPLRAAGLADAALGPLGAEARRHTPGSPLWVEGEAERFELFESVTRLLEQLSCQAPLVLVLDDLHWATKSTLLLLRHLARATEPMALFVLGTYRDTELGRSHPLAEVLADLRRGGDVERIALIGLAAEEVADFVAAATGHALDDRVTELARALHAETQGNPFFIGEVLRHLAESGAIYQQQGRWTSRLSVTELGLPESVREVVSRRLARLSDAANRALSVASVVGPGFSLRLLEDIREAADDPDSLLDSLDEAVRTGLLLEAPGGYAFAHALIRQTLYSELTTARRMRLHRRVGEAIERLPDARKHVEALAHHFREAVLDGQVAKAVEYALAAGRQAIDHVAYEQAVAHLEGGLEALDLGGSPDASVHAELALTIGWARARMGDVEATKEAAVRAAGDARALGSPVLLARAAELCTDLGPAGSDDPTPARLCEEALALLPDEELVWRARILSALGFHRLRSEGDPAGASELTAAGLELARKAGDPRTLVRCLKNRAMALISGAPIAERRAAVEEWLAEAEALGDEQARGRALASRAALRLEVGDREGFDRDLELLDQPLEGRPWYDVWEAKWLCAMRETLAGRFVDAERLVEEVRTHGGQHPNAQGVYAGQLFTIRREQGRLAELRDLLLAVIDQAPQMAAMNTGVALLLAELGHLEEARRVFDMAAVHEFTSERLGQGLLATLAPLSETCGLLGDTTHAETLLRLLLPHSGLLVLSGGVICLGAVDRYCGILAATLGRHTHAERHFERALELERRVGSPPFVARTSLWFARMLVDRAGPSDGERAGDLLAEAGRIAEELGMAGLTDEVTRETRRASGRAGIVGG